MSGLTDNETYEMPVVNAAGAIHQALRFLRVVWYRKQTVLAIGVIVALVGGWYATTATRHYRSSASILLVQHGVDQTDGNLGISRSGQQLMPTHQQLLVSQPVLENAIQYIPQECLTEFKGRNRESWHRRIAGSISVSIVKHTTVMNISYTSTDRRVAVAVVNAVIESYLQFVVETHKGTTAKILDVMTREKDEIGRELAQKEDKLINARLATGDFSIDSGSTVVHPLVQAVITLNEALLEAKKDRLEHQSMVEGIQRAISRGEDLKQYAMAVEETIGKELLLSGLGFNTENMRLRNSLEQGLLEDIANIKSLSSDYGPAHPRILEIENRIQTTRQYIEYHDRQLKSQLDELQANQLGPMLLQMLQGGLNKAAQRESVLQVSLDEARQRAVMHQRDTAHVNMLYQNVQRLRRLHDALIDQIAGVDLRQGHGDIRATIIKEATASGEIVSPRPSRIIMCCVLMTIGIGFGAVYIQDIIDDRFRTPDELSKRVGQPILAMVQALPEISGEGINKVSAHREPTSVFVEAFRTLRTSLALSTHDSSRIAFTSSEPGDGKTTIIANLAIVYAQSGRRTLLIDADLRRPGLTRLLDLKGKRGLSDILYSQEHVAEIVSDYLVPTEVPKLDVISSGPRRQNPSELLGSNKMVDLLAWAETEYDQILVDCPPALVASDAILVSRMVDGTVLVVRPEKNRRKVVFRAVETIAEMGIQLFGIVANCVHTEKGKGYSFGEHEGYGYGYGYGYGENDEGEEDDEAEGGYADINFESKTAEDGSDPSGHPQESPVVPRRAA